MNALAIWDITNLKTTIANKVSTSCEFYSCTVCNNNEVNSFVTKNKPIKRLLYFIQINPFQVHNFTVDFVGCELFCIVGPYAPTWIKDNPGSTSLGSWKLLIKSV